MIFAFAAAHPSVLWWAGVLNAHLKRVLAELVRRPDTCLSADGEEVYSLRIGLHRRALGVRDGDDLIWFWIGSHADDDRMIG